MIDQLLTTRREDVAFDRRSKVAACYDVTGKERAEINRPSFGVDYKYRMKLELYTEFLANDVELPFKKENARKQLIHALYSEAIGRLHEIIGTSSEPEVQTMASELIRKMQG